MILFTLKGLWRDRSRSLFPILIAAAGAFLTVLLYSWMQGAMGNIVDTNARFDTGHVKIMTRAYSSLQEVVPNDLALLEVDNLLARLKGDSPDLIWTPRIRFGGLIKSVFSR